MEAVVENNLHKIGLTKIIGVDEAGRGALFGPVVVGAVMLPPNHRIQNLNDSKKVTPKRRAELAEKIFERAVEVKVAMAMNDVVDRLNIYNATKKCIRAVLEDFTVKPHIVVIDGKFTEFVDDYELPFPYQQQVKGDSLSENVAAASIVAKESRDNWVLDTDKLYPEYGLAKHKGYGTKQHIEALFKHGPCPIHRMSFTIKGKKIGDL